MAISLASMEVMFIAWVLVCFIIALFFPDVSDSSSYIKLLDIFVHYNSNLV